MKVLGPELIKMAEELEKQNLGGKLREFASSIGPMFQDMWPKLIDFLSFLATPEGLEFAKDKVEEFVRSIWVRMKFWAVRKLLPDWMGWLGNLTWNSQSGMTGFGYATEAEQLRTIEKAFQAGAAAQRELSQYNKTPKRMFKPTEKLTGLMGDSPFGKWYNKLIDNNVALQHFLTHDTQHQLGKRGVGGWQPLTIAEGTAIRDI
jgi:hypothetical protein